MSFVTRTEGLKSLAKGLLVGAFTYGTAHTISSQGDYSERMQKFAETSAIVMGVVGAGIMTASSCWNQNISHCDEVTSFEDHPHT